MIVRHFTDNGYTYNVSSKNIELDKNDFLKGALEKSNSIRYINKDMLTETGIHKIESAYPMFDWNNHYEGFTIITEKQLQFEEDEKWKQDYYMKTATEMLRNGKSLSEIHNTKDLITPEYLEHYGWERHSDPILGTLSKKEKEEIGIDKDYIEYHYNIINEKDLSKTWFINMRYQLSNSPNRDWSCHIDNGWRESIGCVDIGTIKQFNTFMNLMDVDYRLP